MLSRQARAVATILLLLLAAAAPAAAQRRSSASDAQIVEQASLVASGDRVEIY